MGAAEELAGDLEGRQSDLSVLLVELRHHRVVQVIDAVVGRSGRRGEGGGGDTVRIPPALRFTVQYLTHNTALGPAEHTSTETAAVLAYMKA